MPKTSCKTLGEFLPAPGGGPDAAYARVVSMRELEAALEELPAEQRKVYLAHEFEGVSIQEPMRAVA